MRGRACQITLLHHPPVSDFLEHKMIWFGAQKEIYKTFINHKASPHPEKLDALTETGSKRINAAESTL